ncbi:probable non-functional immunoglobulin lambda variable 11-55 isoform X3 [Mesocricetus auratus]|uniref:probable non-functional immunoglobulin lambda variable 11-55 isoform X3 n=1 Tax=Mesocricetus auratus TaxID=10036 RepID=UPI001AEFE00F|nr:probable non-functional immunoglobulin lambda variable 11-55 isoform X3 [Mesocricetus auratus]
MAWIPGIVMALSYLTGSFSQSILTQPPSISESLGSTARLTCTLKSDISVGSKNIYWYQQMEGSPPRFFLYYYSDSDKQLGPGVPSRVSGSKDTSKNAANLQISQLQEEDEAVYYCSIWESSVRVFGGGTKVTVLGQPSAAPSVTLFPPSSEELKTNQATLVCMIKEFYPSDVKVTWESDGIPITQGVKTTQPSKRDNKYLATSFLTMTAEAWKSRNSISCQVTHGGTTVEKSLSPAACF